METKLPNKIKEAAKSFNIVKYVLLEWDALDKGKLRTDVQKKILFRLDTKCSIFSKAPIFLAPKETSHGYTLFSVTKIQNFNS